MRTMCLKLVCVVCFLICMLPSIGRSQDESDFPIEVQSSDVIGLIQITSHYWDADGNKRQSWSTSELETATQEIKNELVRKSINAKIIQLSDSKWDSLYKLTPPYFNKEQLIEIADQNRLDIIIAIKIERGTDFHFTQFAIYRAKNLGGGQFDRDIPGISDSGSIPVTPILGELLDHLSLNKNGGLKVWHFVALGAGAGIVAIIANKDDKGTPGSQSLPVPPNWPDKP